MRVRLTPTARLMFLEKIAYIMQDSHDAAVTFRKRAEQKLKRLEQFPESGRRLPEFPDLPFREVLVPPCRFFYRVKGKTVWIVAVWQTAQLPEEPKSK